MRELLNDINNDFFIPTDLSLIQTMIENEVLEKEVLVNKWLGYPPATKQAIADKEQQLGITLPPSYKAFLLVSNGFGFVSPFLNNLLPIEKIDWAKTTEEDWWFDMMESDPIEVPDEEYLTYEKQDSVRCRNEYFRQSLKISEWYDGMCVFLNPLIKHGEEWEVLEYANWYPGAERYRSFEEYLLKVHESNVRLIKNKSRS
jgi:hypothetical protein